MVNKTVVFSWVNPKLYRTPFQKIYSVVDNNLILHLHINILKKLLHCHNKKHEPRFSEIFWQFPPDKTVYEYTQKHLQKQADQYPGMIKFWIEANKSIALVFHFMNCCLQKSWALLFFKIMGMLWHILQIKHSKETKNRLLKNIPILHYGRIKPHFTCTRK